MTKFMGNGEPPARRRHTCRREDDALGLLQVCHEGTDETIDLQVAEFEDADATSERLDVDRRLPFAMMV